MSLFVRFWGTRGSIPTPGHSTRRYGGNTSCVEVRVDDALFICDGGTGMRELGEALLARSSDPVDAHLLLSHTHWDHIQGFPFFLPAYRSTTTLRVYDVERDDDRVHRLLLGQMRPEYFPVDFSELGSRIVPSHLDGGCTTIEGVTVRAFEQVHPGRSFAFSFAKGGTKVVYATDSELDRTVINRSDILDRPHALRALPRDALAFVADADLLIADAQYNDDDYRDGWGHARANTVVDFAIQAGAKQLVLFHHDPTQTDADVDGKVERAMARIRAAGAALTVFGAREGLELKLG
ncbi:MAG: MBL fold metallo-hydrolase [Polyangiaceae bacterium]|nr:MBL fold metallo-hydrolase [Polyangiaceae bacterium]